MLISSTLIPAPLAMLFCGLLGYAVVAWIILRLPQLKGIQLMLLVPMLLGIYGLIGFVDLLSAKPHSNQELLMLKSSCVLAALMMAFCAVLITVFTGLLKRSQEKERSMAEMAATLSFEEEQLTLLVSAIEGMLWQRDPKSGKLLSVSPQAEGFLGYTTEDWLSGTDFLRERVHSHDLGRVLGAWGGIASSGRRYQVEFRFQKKDGTYAMLCENGVALKDGSAKPTICGVLKDISQRHAQVEAQKHLHRQQMEAAHEAGKSEIAKSVLHNIGNVLTSLNVSAKLHVEKLAASRGVNLGKAAKLLRENEENLAKFFKDSPQGRRLPAYLISVSEHLAQESRTLYTDAMSMVQHIEHMRDVIALQQVHGRASQHEEALDLSAIFEQSLALEGEVLRDADIIIERRFADIPPLILPRNLMLQVLVNLVSNARHAISGAGVRERKLLLGISPPQAGRVMLTVRDSGIGISRNNLARIFTHGFTTRKGGNGFGLHHAALLVEEMGGQLRAESEGEGQGSTFFLELPAKFAPAQDGSTLGSSTGPLSPAKTHPA